MKPQTKDIAKILADLIDDDTIVALHWYRYDGRILIDKCISPVKPLEAITVNLNFGKEK